MDEKEIGLKGSKALYVKDTFNQIAKEYDFINTILSFGQITRWRKRLVYLADPPLDGLILDLGAGTGEVTTHIIPFLKGGRVVAFDFSKEMLERAKKKFLPNEEKVSFCLGDAANISFPDHTFDCVLTAFTLRNVEDIPRVLKEMWRVTKEGGVVLSLDLGRPYLPVFRQIYFFYFQRILPLLGNLLSGRAGPYMYFRDSLSNYPEQEVLKGLFLEAGFQRVQYFNLQGGIVAIHKGEK